jgi:hypothetical protein
MSTLDPQDFPYASLSARTWDAGAVTAGDLISHNTTGVAQRDAAADPVTFESRKFAYASDTGELLETARETTTVDGGEASVETHLLTTDATTGVETLTRVYAAAPDMTTITAGSATAYVVPEGLYFDSATAALYIGSREVRIQYATDALTGKPTLRIQAHLSTSTAYDDADYVTKFAVTND